MKTNTIEPLDRSTDHVLTARQELFAQYMTSDTDAFDNRTLSYSLAYDIDFDLLDRTREKDQDGKEIIGTSEYDKQYSYCAIAGSRMMKVYKVASRIKELMAEKIEDDAFADSRLMKIVRNGKDNDAINAIKHRNELKQRIVKKLDITVTNDIAKMSDEELLKMVEKGQDTQK